MQPHIDPLNTLVVVAAFLGLWLTERTKHMENQGKYQELMIKVQVSIATLTEIVVAQRMRLERLERRVDKDG